MPLSWNEIKDRALAFSRKWEDEESEEAQDCFWHDPFYFGVLNSAMHMAWVRYTWGRLESRYRYSKDIVYNNDPWPMELGAKQSKAVDAAAQGVLDTRAQFPKSSLADLYDPLTMPPALARGHQTLDKAVDAAYLSGTGRKPFASDAERVAFLFELYQQYTSLLPTEKSSKKKRIKKED